MFIILLTFSKGCFSFMIMKEERMLTERQKRFCREYVNNVSVVEAYANSGYTARGASASAAASRMLTKPNVRACIEELRAKLDDDSIMKKKEYLQHLTRIVRQAPGKLSKDSSICQEFEDYGEDMFKTKLPNKLEAGKQLAKLQGWEEPDKLEVNTTTDLFSALMRKKRESEEEEDDS